MSEGGGWERIVIEHLLVAKQDLEAIWDAIGICDQQREERMSVVSQHLVTLLNEMVGEEKHLQTVLMKNTEELSGELVKICKELSLDICYPPEGLTLMQLERELRTKVDSLALEKQSRLKKLKKLREQNIILCNSLGAEPFFIPDSTVPSKDLLVQIEGHTKTLLAEKENRLKTFYLTKNTIIDLYRELEKKPTAYERSLYKDEEIVLLLETLTALENLKQELADCVKSNKSEVLVLREELSKLWDRLQIEQVERDKFVGLYPGHSPTAMRALKEEIEKLKILQKQNVKKFVTSMRQQLEGLWDKCFFSRDQRDLFRAFHDDSFTEELLESHILEVEKMETYLETNKDLIQKITRRNQLWNRMLEFEKRASDPNRFTNRGGNLLQEEKERKKLMKELPKLEAELEKLALEWEIKHAKVFRVNGQRLVDYVNEQWENYKAEKENEKIERQKAKTKQIEEELYKGSKLLTPSGKRKLDTPKTSARKRVKLQESRTPKTHSSLSVYNSPIRHLPRSIKMSALNRSKRTRGTPVSGVVLRRSLLRERNADIFSQTTVTSNAAANNTAMSLASTINSYGDFSTNIRKLDGIFNSTSVQISPSSSPQRQADTRMPSVNELNTRAKRDPCRSSAVTPGKSPRKLNVFKPRGRLPFFT